MFSLMNCCCFSLLVLMSAILHVYGDAADFISIDCGYKGNPYIDPTTGLSFTSDNEFVTLNTGVKNEISPQYKTPSLSKQSFTVRSFPNGSRNCYTLPAKQNGKYLLRAGFMYGDYDDGLTMKNNKNSFVFGLHLGVNSWANVSIEDPSENYMFEAIMVPQGYIVSVCLINMNQGTPFISSLEMRPFNDSTLYPAATSDQTLALTFRYNMGPTDEKYIIRIWKPYTDYSTEKWLQKKGNISYPITYLTNDEFLVPSNVLLTALEPTTYKDTYTIPLSWTPHNYFNNPHYYLILHFCELYLNESALRKADVNLNSNPLNGSVVLDYMVAQPVYTNLPISSSYFVDIYANKNSTYVPLLNAWELYYTISMSKAVTLSTDVVAMNGIQQAYGIKIVSWQGDPCAPIGYTWDLVSCTSLNQSLRVTYIDLSLRGLKGSISNKFSDLSELVFLDISHNSLNGPIPEFLGTLASLKVLNLSHNCLGGPIPNNLQSKSGFTLIYDGYNSTCANESSSKSNHILIIIILPIVVVMFLVGLVVFFIWRKTRKTQDVSIQNESRQIQATPMAPESSFKNANYENELGLSEMCKFSYRELENITNNFARFIGQGGFGPVYHGYSADKKEVAVKMCAHLSNHGMKEFLAEVVFLGKVHHRNLVQLIGYCIEDTHLGLVYEYMSQGCLTDHLRGRDPNTRALSWRERLQIAVDATQGLDYLHSGCDAPVIHRDVKSSNILLDHNLRAKIADFGLSRAYKDNNQTHCMSTKLAGTLGYIDMQYNYTGKITEKTDVYSFGVVLLELVTGEAPIDPEMGHITIRVNEKLMQGDIDSIADNKFGGNYDMNSIWKVVDIAIRSTAQSFQKRPTMGEVVTLLKESLTVEIARENRTK